MENLTTTFDYPIVIKHIHGFLTISVPDLGISEKIPIDKNFHEEKKLEQNKEHIWKFLSDIIKVADSHRKTKKWVPNPSQIKAQLKKAEKDYSLPEFQKALSSHISISENTIRREIQRGKIICYTTEGGHRRIPESELQRYLKESLSFK
ncbi:MAG: helix-turn-helix domain-containing protein [Pseudobdellovibrio sp.]